MNSLVASRAAISAIFFVCGFAFAVWASRIPAIKEHLGLNVGEFGLVLLGMPIGLVFSMQLTGWGIARLGSKWVNMAASVAYCLVLPLLALAPNGWALAAVLFAFGFTQAAMDISMNAQAVELGKRYSRPIMSSFHALFSLGGLVGAGLGSVAAALSVTPLPFFSLMMVVSLLIVLVSFRYLVETPLEPGGVHFAWPKGVLLGLGLILFCTGLGEGAMVDWAAVFMRQVMGSSEAVAALAFSVFSVSMVIGRLTGDWFTHRFGPVRLARGSGIVAIAGLLALVLAPQPWVALLGFLLTGFGFCSLFPLVFSAAGKVPGINPGVALASVATLGYMGFLTGPPLIGLIGHASSLQVSFAVLMVLMLVIPLWAGLLDVERGASSQGRGEQTAGEKLSG
ncbi:MAG: MFS transporter [Meiothermus sp.]|nr:MFS transporter [Meiothermus sp.]